ncbi:sigma factor-like helix-turn-helix DNA-binding protein [Mycoplasmopsis cynos]|uniref:Sigma-70, region 4 n=2 Tax=Mycoplasmopsis cynos TaxID=171284 RepID=L0RU67_MYCC1|nr:sigma factor-like helix-turn-helix DNA-binding protein [Mycoplasmopsis cynos]MCU9932575.1 hypothetical protein [Mycoplasmopsis cynos]MCU9935089.1 hypothetical protein [Mycoplasmopsis cynos]TQC55059.1 hypothetical protein E1I74_00130 [Mycoplasmopsis cynos]UWV80701.1 hypothetical protein NW069_00605 [Mycoplasmopsis cynos]UWV86156.1 hypothetical protein NW063_05115 [Mycoplasmopsis cynos]
MSKKEPDNINKYTILYEKYKNFLTQTQKQVFELYFFQDLSYSEIAEITATSRTAAYDAIKKAIKKLEKFENEIYQE